MKSQKMGRRGIARVAEANGALQEGRQEGEAQRGDGSRRQPHTQGTCNPTSSLWSARAIVPQDVRQPPLVRTQVWCLQRKLTPGASIASLLGEVD